jgi:hypothetical protein
LKLEGVVCLGDITQQRITFPYHDLGLALLLLVLSFFFCT